MSQTSARNAEKVLKELLKAKGVSKDVISNINTAERDATRLLSSVSQLARGDVTGIAGYLAGLGPKGLALAVILEGLAVGYEIYKHVTTPTPSEVYHWRYSS